MRRAAAIVGAALLAGCIDDLDPKTLIVAPRVVEVVAEPPEVRPGQASTLSVFLAGTRGEARYRWSVCPVTDLGAIGDANNASLSDCFRDGAALLPLSTGAQATFVLPEPLLARVTEAAARFGAALPPGVIETFLRDVGLAVPVVVEIEVDGRTLRAVKRVVVSQSASPNTNPPPPRVRMNDRWVSVPRDATDRRRCVPEDGDALRFSPGQRVTLTPDPEEPWLQAYTVLTADGRFERRDEQAFYSWYATGGSLRGLTRSPLRDNEWTAPETSPTTRDQSLWVLVRDGHGGASGCRIDLRVEP